MENFCTLKLFYFLLSALVDGTYQRASVAEVNSYARAETTTVERRSEYDDEYDDEYDEVEEPLHDGDGEVLEMPPKAVSLCIESPDFFCLKSWMNE